MEKDFEYVEVQTGLPAERALDVAATLASLIPLIGGPAASILSGLSNARKEQRVLEVLRGLSDDLCDFQTKVTEEYVRTEDFQDLFENTMRRVAQERNEEKRRLYRNVLVTAIKHPGGDCEEQLRLVRTLEDLSPSHIITLRALIQQPEADLGNIGSVIQTLSKRLPNLTEVQIENLVNELNDHRLTSLTSLRTVMTAHGAANLQHAVTLSGQRLLNYLQGK